MNDTCCWFFNCAFQVFTGMFIAGAFMTFVCVKVRAAVEPEPRLSFEALCVPWRVRSAFRALLWMCDVATPSVQHGPRTASNSTQRRVQLALNDTPLCVS